MMWKWSLYFSLKKIYYLVMSAPVEAKGIDCVLLRGMLMGDDRRWFWAPAHCCIVSSYKNSHHWLLATGHSYWRLRRMKAIFLRQIFLYSAVDRRPLDRNIANSLFWRNIFENFSYIFAYMPQTPKNAYCYKIQDKSYNIIWMITNDIIHEP